jgi:hypothetical protein
MLEHGDGSLSWRAMLASRSLRTVVSFEVIARDNGRVFFDHLESLFVVSKIATRATHEFRNSAVDKILPRLL